MIEEEEEEEKQEEEEVEEMEIAGATGMHPCQHRILLGQHTTASRTKIPRGLGQMYTQITLPSAA
jgi:hypothetical protein